MREANGGSVDGLTPGDFAAYYIVWTLVRNMNIVLTPFAWEERIKEGMFAGQLMKPVHPIHEDIAGFMGWKIVVLLLWIPIAAVLVVLFRPTLSPTLLQCVVFFFAIWGAYLIRAIMQWSLGLITFWTTRVAAVFEAYYLSEMLLSGRVFPLVLMPEVVPDLDVVLPVPLVVQLPDRRAHRPDRRTAICSSVSACRWRGSCSASAFCTSCGHARCGASARSVGDMAKNPHRAGSVRLTGTFLRIGVMNEMQYRINFFLQLLQSLLTVGTGLVILAVVFSKTNDLGGWSRPQLLAVMGVFTLVGGIIRTFIQPNMQRVVNDVREGKLDYALTKPADAQLLVSVRDVRFWQLTDVLVGLVVLIVALVQLTPSSRWQDMRGLRRVVAQRVDLDLLLLADARRPPRSGSCGSTRCRSCSTDCSAPANIRSGSTRGGFGTG